MQNRPIISVAIRSKNTGDCDRLLSTLNILARSHLTTTIDAAGRQAIVRGMNASLHESICRVVRHYQLDLDISKPRVIYLETIRTQGEAQGKYIKQTEGEAITGT